MPMQINFQINATSQRRDVALIDKLHTFCGKIARRTSFHAASDVASSVEWSRNIAKILDCNPCLGITKRCEKTRRRRPVVLTRRLFRRRLDGARKRRKSRIVCLAEHRFDVASIAAPEPSSVHSSYFTTGAVDRGFMRYRLSHLADRLRCFPSADWKTFRSDKH